MNKKAAMGPSGFEPESPAPKAGMLGQTTPRPHYTNTTWKIKLNHARALTIALDIGRAL